MSFLLSVHLDSVAITVLLTCLVSMCCTRIRSLHYCYGKAKRWEHHWREMREFSPENQAEADT
jgi:hypothetical protein